MLDYGMGGCGYVDRWIDGFLYRLWYGYQFQIIDWIMNVKPEIFQATKQTILKNKHQFIQIQLKQLSKRITTLKSQNSNLKSQISQLKSKPQPPNSTNPNPNPNPNLNTKQSLANRHTPQNKQNKCINLLKNKSRHVQLFTDTQRYQDRGKGILQGQGQGESGSNGKAGDQEDTDGYYDGEGMSEELKELQKKFQEEEKEREKELLYLEDYIRMLKRVWMEKQAVGRSQYQGTGNQPTVRQRQLKQLGRIEKTSIAIPPNKRNFFTQNQSNLLTSIQTQNTQKSYIQPSKFLSSNSLNTSNYSLTRPQPNQLQTLQKHPEPRRKTMSLNLNNSSGNLMGFHFGKKSINKAKQVQRTQVSHFNHKERSQRDVLPYNSDQVNVSSFSNSILSHSNSRNSMSIMSNASNKSQLKRSEASKSYAKIVTKLKCKGCAVEYRPNEYYSHIEQCRDFLKITLLQQKSRVQDEINQTLNLSLCENHY